MFGGEGELLMCHQLPTLCATYREKSLENSRQVIAYWSHNQTQRMTMHQEKALNFAIQQVAVHEFDRDMVDLEVMFKCIYEDAYDGDIYEPDFVELTPERNRALWEICSPIACMEGDKKGPRDLLRLVEFLMTTCNQGAVPLYRQVEFEVQPGVIRLSMLLMDLNGKSLVG